MGWEDDDIRGELDEHETLEAGRARLARDLEQADEAFAVQHGAPRPPREVEVKAMWDGSWVVRYVEQADADGIRVHSYPFTTHLAALTFAEWLRAAEQRRAA